MSADDEKGVASQKTEAGNEKKSSGDEKEGGAGLYGELVQPFVDLVKAPRVLWGVNAAYLIEGMVYFGMLMYMGMYFNEYVGLNDNLAANMIGILTGGITLSMFLLGGLADRWGVRIALIGSFVLMIIGRVAMAAAPSLGLSGTGLFSPVHLIAMGGILLIVIGYGMYQPAAYSAIRQFTTPKTASMAFAMLYALMNLGGWLPSFFGGIRKTVGIAGSYWFFAAASVVALFLTVLLLTKKVVADTLAKVKAEKEAMEKSEKSDDDGKAEEKAKTEDVDQAGAKPKNFVGSVWHWLRTHPMADPKFAFFILALVPVQTLFAHNWLTLPLFVERAYAPKIVMESCEGLTSSKDAAALLPDAAGSVTELIPDSSEAWGVGVLKTTGSVTELVKLGKDYGPRSKEELESLPGGSYYPSSGFKEGCEANNALRKIAMMEEKGANEAQTEAIEKRAVTARRAVRSLDYAIASKAANWSDRLSLWLGENFEFAVNFNPILIFILVPMVAAVTRKAKPYSMMIIGTAVMAAPTFLLVLGANFWTLLGFLVLMTLGESMWSPRFLQYAAEIAPEGRTAAYMGVAQFPWFLTKILVPLYSGRFLAAYVPAVGAVHSEMMWLYYGLIAMASTVLLVLAKGWVGKDFKTKAA